MGLRITDRPKPDSGQEEETLRMSILAEETRRRLARRQDFSEESCLEFLEKFRKAKSRIEVERPGARGKTSTNPHKDGNKVAANGEENLSPGLQMLEKVATGIKDKKQDLGAIQKEIDLGTLMELLELDEC